MTEVVFEFNDEDIFECPPDEDFKVENHPPSQEPVGKSPTKGPRPGGITFVDKTTGSPTVFRGSSNRALGPNCLDWDVKDVEVPNGHIMAGTGHDQGVYLCLPQRYVTHPTLKDRWNDAIALARKVGRWAYDRLGDLCVYFSFPGAKKALSRMQPSILNPPSHVKSGPKGPPRPDRSGS